MRTYTLELPGKRLKMKRIGVNNPVRAVIAALFLLLVAAGIAWWVADMGKAIYADYKIGQAYHAIDADIKGECKTRKAIFTGCKATIRHDGHTVEKTFAFFDFSSGDYTVTAIAANDNPANITLDIAVDKIMNRAVLALMFLAALLLCLWLALYGLFITLPRSRALLAGLNRKEAQPWQLTEIEANQKGDKIVSYLVEHNGKTVKIGLNFGKASPWIVGDHDGSPLLLAFAPRDGGAAVPFDDELKSIGGLNKSERRAFIEKIKNAVLTD